MSEATIRLARPDELPRAAAVLARHGEELEHIRRGVAAAGRRLEERSRDAVAQFEGRLKAARSKLGDAQDEREYEQRRREVEAAERTLVEGLRRHREVERLLADLERRTGQHVLVGRELADKGWRGLRGFWERLDRASSAFSSAVARHRAQPSVADPRRITGGGAPGRSSGTGDPLREVSDGLLDELRDQLVDHVRDQVADGVRDAIGGGGSALCHYPSVGTTDRVLVPVEDLFDPDPVTGPESFGKVSLAEMLEGLRVLEEYVLPVVRRGGGPEELRRLEAQRGPDSNLLRIHDAFFGGEEHAIRVTREPGGRLRLDAGRHRLYAARRRHLDVLPVLLAEAG